MVAIPTLEDGDARRPNRERQTLVGEHLPRCAIGVTGESLPLADSITRKEPIGRLGVSPVLARQRVLAPMAPFTVFGARSPVTLRDLG